MIDGNLHCIPVGGAEPVHRASESCWCHPVRDAKDWNLYVHNARDCREKLERQGVETRPDSLWVIVGD